MNLRTNIRSLLEEAFFNLSKDLDKESSEKMSLYLVEMNLNSNKNIYENRIKNNDNLKKYIINSKDFDKYYSNSGLMVIDAITDTLKLEIKEIEDKLYDLQILKNK